MAKPALAPEEEFSFVPDVDDDEQFDFQVDVEPEDEFSFTPDVEEEPPDNDLINFTVDKSFDVAGQEQFDQVAFTNDVMSMPFEVADPSDIPVEQEEKDPIKFVEAFKNKAGEPLELLPFVGPMFKVSRIGRVMLSASRIKRNPEPPKQETFLFDETPQQFATRQVEWMNDRYVLADWLAELDERQTRGLSVGGRIAEGILELPAFMLEFLATGGVFAGAKQGTKRTIARILQRSGEKFAPEFVKKVSAQTGIKLVSSTAGIIAGTAARTGFQFTRVLESSFQRLTPGIEITKEGKVVFQEAQDKPFTAFAKGFGSVYFENLSEISGPALTKVGKAIIGRFPFLSKFDDAMKALWLSKNPNKTGVDFVKTVGTKVGYHGFLEEIGEEQINKILLASTGIETFGAKQTGEPVQDFFARMIAAIPSGQDLLVEAGVLAFPAGAVAVTGAIAGRQAPTLTEVTEEVIKIDRTTPEAIQQISAAVAEVKALPKEQQRQREQESVAKVKERISFKKPKVLIRQRFKDLLFKTDKAFRDEFAGLRRVVEAADVGDLAPADDPVQLAVAFTQKSSAKTRGFVLESTTDLAGNRKSKGLKQIFSPIIKDGGKEKFEEFVTYLVAARDLNLQKQNKETGIDPVAARLTFDALDSPEFAQAAKEVTEWNHKGIDLLVESGRITRESGEAIKLANPIYAPFFREFVEEPGIAAKGRKFVPKRIKGSKRKIIDPIEGMIQQMDAVIQSSQRAAIEKSLANLAALNPEALESFITPTRAVIPTKFTVEEIKDQLEDIGIDFAGVEDVDLNELLTVFRPQAVPITPGVIKLKVEGKNKFFKVEKELLDVLDGTEVYKLGPFWDIVIGKPTRLLKLGATGLNPAFGLIRNPIRDIQTFTVTSEFAKGGPFSAVAGILKDVKTKASGIAQNFGFESLKESSDVAKFAALGGEMSGFISQDRAGTRHIQHEMLASNGVRYTINTFRHPIDALRSLVGITEIGTRIGEFSAALKEGEKLYGKGSLSASVFALNAAQDVTTNFTRHGQIGKQINQVIPFFNASIQGPDKIVRSFNDRPLKSTVAAVSALTVPAIFFWWKNKDKEWYKNQTAHEKANYIQFEHPDKEDVIFRFPVAFELGHIFQAIPIAFLDAAYRNNPKEITKILGATLKTANPLDWPSLIGPIIDIQANEDFAGRPVVSRSNEGKLPEDQFGPQTTELMKIIGKTINMSPSQIEHMVNSYTGGIYSRVSRILKSNDVEKQPADIPIIGTLFVRDPYAPKRQIQEFYDERELLNKKFQSKKITLPEVFRRIIINNFATVLNVSFESLKEVESIEQRKAIWKDIGNIVSFTDEIVSK